MLHRQTCNVNLDLAREATTPVKKKKKATIKKKKKKKHRYKYLLQWKTTQQKTKLLPK